MWNIFKRYQKTNFRGGDLLEDLNPILPDKLIRADIKFVAPPQINHKDECLTASNQGNKPHCAGYSTAGYVEFQNWKFKHYPEQVDGDAIYLDAKKHDGFSGNGTYLRFALEGAINLNLIKGIPKGINRTAQDIKFAIHQYGVVVAGFKITDEWNKVEKNTGRIAILTNPKSLGGHAVLICGYCSEGVYIQNSWSEMWGDRGFALLPWELFYRQIMDAMVIDEIKVI